MMENSDTGRLVPVDFDQISAHFPELSRMKIRLESVALKQPIDSSNASTETWAELALLLEENYANHDGFVILHGTDTMAYTASALSFMLENLTKPVIITGSQLPIGMLRTDGKENIISAIEIAAAQHNSQPIVREVAIYFGDKLMRGNRTHKYSTENFDAIESSNYGNLAEVGVHIRFAYKRLLRNEKDVFTVHKKMNENVGVLQIFPGISDKLLTAVLATNGLKGLILETYGSGNVPDKVLNHSALKLAIEQGLIVVNVTQCNKGFVEPGRYGSSWSDNSGRVISAGDMTTEAALTKLMFLLGCGIETDEFKKIFTTSIRGELTEELGIE